MSRHHVVRYLVIATSVLAGVSCGDLSHPMAPAPSKQVSPTAPVGASFSRYILISGVWTCVENCDNIAK